MTQPNPASPAPPAPASPGRLDPLSRRRLLAGALASAAIAACGAEKRETAPPSPTSSQPAEPASGAAPTPPAPTPVPVSPLSGQVVPDPALLRRRIVAVKIDNAPPARPQFGLGFADLVYEQLAEGGLTRFLALFLQNEPDRVGPVRSARLTDIYLAQEWDFLLAYAGAGRTTSQLLADAVVPLFKAPELGERLEGTPYFRDPNRIVPHNLFVRVAGVREAAAKDANLAKEVEIHPFPFAEAPAEAGPLRAVSLPYTGAAAAVTWHYDTDANVWRRIMGGQNHVDALDKQQIQADNVLLQYANIFTTRNAEPDSAGNPVLDTVLRGENRLRLFHSGQVFEGTWVKEHDRAKTEYRLADGSPLPFRPGRVWIHILPTDFNATWSA